MKDRRRNLYDTICYSERSEEPGRGTLQRAPTIRSFHSPRMTEVSVKWRDMTWSVLALLLIAGCSYPELVERGENAPASHQCSECHIEIYEEWKDSPHAKSFSNPAFREAAYNYQFEFCLGCHAPESVYIPVSPGGQTVPTGPVPRHNKREEGVNCNGCHLTEDCKLAGPLKARAPHPVSNVHDLYKRSVLCGTCHRGTFTGWQALSIKDKKSCQECHMSDSERKLIQDAPWRWLYRNKATRRHTFSSEDGLKAVKAPVNIELKEIGVSGPDVVGVVELENSSVPHSIPTGDYGYREAALIIETVDASGKKTLIKEESFFTETGTALEYGKRKDIAFSFPSGLIREGSHLEISLVRRSFDGTVKAVLAQESVPINNHNMHGYFYEPES